MSHISESCHTWMSHVTLCDMESDWVTAPIRPTHYFSAQMFEFVCQKRSIYEKRPGKETQVHVKSDQFIAFERKYLNSSQHIDRRAISDCAIWLIHMWYGSSCHSHVSHIAHMPHMHRVISHVNTIWLTWLIRSLEWCHASQINESCHKYTSHVTHEWDTSHVNEKCHAWISHVTHEWFMAHMKESCHTHDQYWV